MKTSKNSFGDDILNKTSFESENLYLEGCHENLTIRSRIVIFVLNYCKTDNDIFRVLLCDPSGNKTTSSTSSTPLCLPNELKCEWLKSEDIPDVVLQSKLPAILSSDRLLCSVGLCIVLRRIVRQTHNKSPERNLIALLGHQQSCLRGFAEGSSWTKYCEIELPADVDQCLTNKNIPTSILKFEKCLSLPVRISNRKKHQRILRKSMSDRKLKEDEVKGATGVSLGASKSVDSEDNSSCSETAGEILKHGVINCSPKPSKKPKVISEPEIDIKSDSSISDNTSKPCTISKKQCTTSKPVSEEFLPQLEHIFAEGINMSLIDLVVFPCVHLILHQAVQSNQMTLFWRSPLVLMWYRRMWDVKEVKNCAEACKMSMVMPLSKVMKSLSNLEEMVEVELDAPNTEGTGMKEAKPVSKRGMRMGIQRKAATLLEALNDEELVLKFVKHPSSRIKILWDQLPPQVHPAYGDVPGERSQRKCQQIENIVAAVKLIAKPGDYVVDFCSGGGHLGIVLAAVLPDCHIILVESKEVSIIKGLNRVKELGLKNVTFYLGNIDYYHGKFDIGVSLHACGVATDMVITRCIQNDASFVSSPCCYGAVRDTHVITYPRSERLREKPLCFEDYRILAHAAEHTTWDFDSDTAKQAKSCMACIDSDRLFYSMEHGYQVWMTTMEPFTCTPKNNLLIGVNTNRADKLSI